MRIRTASVIFIAIACIVGCARHAGPVVLHTLAPTRAPMLPPTPSTPLHVRTPPPGLRTPGPIQTQGPRFGPTLPPPPPEPMATPYHFSTEHLYVAGTFAGEPKTFGHIWMYSLPITDSQQLPDVDVRLTAVPHGLAVDKEGDLFVTVDGPPSILEFSVPFAVPRTAVLHSVAPIASGGTTPADAIAINADDRIFVTDPAHQQVAVYGHSIDATSSPQFTMPDSLPGTPLDAAFGANGELFVSTGGAFQAPSLIKYQVPFSVTRQPVLVNTVLGSGFVGFTRFPQRLFFADASGGGIGVYEWNYEQTAAFYMPHVPGVFQYSRLTIDNDDNLYVLGADGQQWFVYVFYRPHGQASQPAWVVPVPPQATASGIAIGP